MMCIVIEICYFNNICCHFQKRIWVKKLSAIYTQRVFYFMILKSSNKLFNSLFVSVNVVLTDIGLLFLSYS